MDAIANLSGYQVTEQLYAGSHTLVMEDFGGISLSTYLKAESDRKQLSNFLDLTEFLNLAIQLIPFFCEAA